MPRFLAGFAFCLAAFFASSLSAADDKNLTIRWHGQSFFEIISTKGTRIVLDPHAIEAYGRKSVLADLVLITHFHDDHTQTGVIENLKTAKVSNGLKVEKDDVRRVEWNLINEKFKDVTVRSIGTYHDAMSGMQRGKNAVFIIDVDGLRIVHLGDLGHELSDAQLRRIGEVDVLMIPVGGVYTLNGLTAAKVVDQIKPKRLILPMHYGTIVWDYLLKVDTFLNEMKPENIKRYPTNQILVDPKAPVPAEPIVAVLHWAGKGDK
jgi:L-ascorbate metabolism protein UlaG (beta-lactamase superfamily)